MNSLHLLGFKFKYWATIVFAFQILLACTTPALADTQQTSTTSAIRYLAETLDQFHREYWVYQHGGAAGNHVVCFGRMTSYDNAFKDARTEAEKSALEKRMATLAPAMDLFYPIVVNETNKTTSCIKAQYCPNTDAGTTEWAGWYFYLNGVVRSEPKPDKSGVSRLHYWVQPDFKAVKREQKGAGINLNDANTVSFYAKGENGGERVDFFVFGVNRDAQSNRILKGFEIADTSPKTILGHINLTSYWKLYKIDLPPGGREYVLGGFGWAASGKTPVVFYINRISYDIPRLQEPRFAVSYPHLKGAPEERVLMSTAFVYDNVLTLMAFLATKDYNRAKIIADALVKAQTTDRYYSGESMRNAYCGGDLLAPAGWKQASFDNPDLLVTSKTAARIPGSQDLKANKYFVEDAYAASRNTGNMAWAMLGLLAYHELAAGTAKSEYLTAAEKLGDWIAMNCTINCASESSCLCNKMQNRQCSCKNISLGFTGGFEGFEGNETKVYYKATEHNIDLYAAFERLYRLTNDQKWRGRAESAFSFVDSMWDENEGKFYTGTTNDCSGKINMDIVPLDVQPWSLLSFRDQGQKYAHCLEYAEEKIRYDDGFDFSLKFGRKGCCTDKGHVDGIWYEGTAQMATAYKLINFGNPDWKTRSEKLLTFLRTAQEKDGGMRASNIPNLWTGLYLMTADPHENQPWNYHDWSHIGATAWLVLAECGFNPFWPEKAP